jgi:hypothetical protein
MVPGQGTGLIVNPNRTSGSELGTYVFFFALVLYHNHEDYQTVVAVRLWSSRSRSPMTETSPVIPHEGTLRRCWLLERRTVALLCFDSHCLTEHRLEPSKEVFGSGTESALQLWVSSSADHSAKQGTRYCSCEHVSFSATQSYVADFKHIVHLLKAR